MTNVENTVKSNFSYRKTTRKYQKKKIRYPLYDVEGGKKAYIPDIVKITIQRILEAIKYKGKPGLLKVEIVYGFDGAG